MELDNMIYGYQPAHFYFNERDQFNEDYGLYKKKPEQASSGNASVGDAKQSDEPKKGFRTNLSVQIDKIIEMSRGYKPREDLQIGNLLSDCPSAVKLAQNSERALRPHLRGALMRHGKKPERQF